MKLPKHTLAQLEDLWAKEYQSDYEYFIKLEKPVKASMKNPSARKELAAISTI